jgi:hypothetical protein
MTKNPYAVLLGSIKSEKKAIASRENGKQGGYWKQARNKDREIQGINRNYETH